MNRKLLLDRLAIFGIPVICGFLPFFAAIYGYGAYLRYPSIVGTFVMVLVAGLFLALLWKLLRSLFVAPCERSVGGLKLLATMVILICIVFFVGRFAGIQVRNSNRELICTRCDPIIEAIERYRLRYGAYPESLSLIPEVQAMIVRDPIVVREGQFTKHGINIENLSGADAVFYLKSNFYICVVPIEEKLPFSISRFYVFIRDSEEAKWRQDYLIWQLHAVTK